MIALTRWYRPRSFAVLVAIGLIGVTPDLSHGQSFNADASHFRPGQMGVEFGVGGTFTSVGLLRFTDLRRALLFDVQAQLGRRSNGSSIAGVSLPDEDAETTYLLSTRLGLRRYRAVTENVERFATLGVQAQFSRTSLELRPSFVTETKAGGAFAELGAAWMVTPNLSLGAVWNASLLYASDTRTVLGNETNSSQLLANLGTVAIRANIYF